MQLLFEGSKQLVESHVELQFLDQDPDEHEEPGTVATDTIGGALVMPAAIYPPLTGGAGAQ